MMVLSSFEESVTLLVAALVPSVATAINLLNYQIMVHNNDMLYMLNIF